MLKMKIIYITRHFNHSGYIILNRLIEESFDIVAVVLHRDQNLWRNKLLHLFLKYFYNIKCLWYRCRPLKITASEEVLAKRYNIPILFINSIKDDSAFDAIKSIAPDIIVMGGGWHELLPRRIFSLAPLGCINTHPSLLPEFRGTSITRWQVFQGIEKSGSVIHYVDENFDTGGILTYKEIAVSSMTTPQELFKDLAYAGAEIMVDLLYKFRHSGPQPTFHRTGNAEYIRYYSRWNWNNENLRINWSLSLREIHFHILANTQESYEYAGPWFLYNGKRFILRITQIHKAEDFKMEEINDNLYVIKKSKKSLFIHRKGELYVIELAQMQLDDSIRKIRRGKSATSFIILNKNQIFLPC